MTSSRGPKARRRRLAACLAACLGVALVPTLSTGAAGREHRELPRFCRAPAHPRYASHRCKVARLQQRSFVVVAVIDTGINPYHLDFRLPEDDDMIGVHPSRFIDGFPAEAEAFELTLAAPSYEAAVAADKARWNAVLKDELYTFPGTKVIGGYAVPGTADRWGGRILDEHGHGTATASVAAGLIHGSNRDVETLIVPVQGLGTAAVAWATNQPWVDIVSNSWGQVANVYVPFGAHRTTKGWVERGGVFAVAAGNGITNTGACDRAVTLMSWMSGPPWHLVVGAVSPRNNQPHCWHSIPPDVSSYGSRWPAAKHDSLREERNFGGTSNATPLVAGVVASLVLEARRTFGDAREGPSDGALARIPGGKRTQAHRGLLADGVLTRAEAEEAVLKTAAVEEFEPTDAVSDPFIWPNTSVYYVYAGYGLVNSDTKQHALDVMFGRADMPDRRDVDEWMERRDAIGNLLWNNLP